MLVNLSNIMSAKDKVEHISVSFEPETFRFRGEEYPFVLKNPVDLTITVPKERVVKVEGSTRVSLNIPCNRCLEDVETFFDITISRQIDFNDTDEDKKKELDEANYLDGYDLKVDQLVFEEISLQFPLSVLCKEDCKGLCNVCGQNLNHGTCNCESTSLDPRMSVIRDIFNNFKEV